MIKSEACRSAVKNNKGQSFFEVVVALALISIVLITLIAMGSASIKASTFSRNQTQATRFSEQAIEWLREERDVNWAIFKTRATTLNWCLDSLYWLKPGTCPASGLISGTNFTRFVVFSNIDANTVQAQVTTTWTDAQGVHPASSTTVFTNFK